MQANQTEKETKIWKKTETGLRDNFELCIQHIGLVIESILH